jgi:PBP1b-binding outer membrane lipoprotein LpoB
MNMSLSILDLALIGATTGLTTLASMYLTMVFMKRLDRKRKLIVMEEIMSQMHDKAKTESEFEEIVNQLKNRRSSFDE